MTKWLFDSRGSGVAFISGGNVFTAEGKFVGKLEGNEIWNGSYVGEVIQGERLARRRMPPMGLHGLPALPGLPSLPGLTGLRGTMLYPATHEDLDLSKLR